jgi:ubiquinone/menaquinone biosynthesis C-methylase UbiE
MSDPIKRFTTRVETYAKYRPGYPDDLVDLLNSECELNEKSVIADVGSGTGILSELLLKNGNEVIGVEPNAAMRDAAETLLKGYPRFRSVDGSAEATTLPVKSVDLITAGQAFHWFDRPKARTEFLRILKPLAFVVLIWNDRRLASTPFLTAYEDLLQKYGTDYQQVSHLNVTGEISQFFAPGTFELRTFENSQRFDFESLKGRVFSASYTPEPGHPHFEPMIKQLREVFDANQIDSAVSFDYDTKVYYGRLTEG